MNATLTIYEENGTSLATVVVNEGSVRRYELMKDDYIVVKFSLGTPVAFSRGCYTDIADIGRFVVTDKVTAAYNTTTGGYDYQLRMDAQYMRWKNKLIKFLPQIGCAEVSWSLTATAQVHLEQIVANVNSLGSANDTWHKFNGTTDWDCSVSADIDPDLAKAIDYDGITIIDALAAVAEAFETEWYVAGNTIYLGKCQDNSASTLEVSLGDSARLDTAASMSRSDSKTAQATRIYPYGSDKNIPSKYRKDLVLDALQVNGARFSDTTRKMLGGYFKTIVEQSQKDITLTNLQVCNARYARGKKNIVVSDWSPFSINHGSQQRPVWNSAASVETLEKGAYYIDLTNFNLYAYIGCNKDFENYDFRNQYNAVLSLVFGIMANGTWTPAQTIYERTFNGDWGKQIIGRDDDKLLGYEFDSSDYIGGILLPAIEISERTANCAVVLHFELVRNESVPRPSDEDASRLMAYIISTETIPISSDNGLARFVEPKPRIKARFNARLVHYDNGVATSSDLTGLVFNPDMEQDESDAANVIQLPEGTTVSQGDKIFIPDSQVTSDVPASYYSPKYNLDVQMTYGDDDDNVIKSGVVDNRLMLPEDEPPYVQVDGISDEEAVEQIVVFDDVYPRQVSSIGTIDASHTTTDKQENDDNTVSERKYPDYWFKFSPSNEETPTSGDTPTSVNDPLAEFDPHWALEGGTLEITFQSGMLNGFTFEVVFNPANAPLHGDNDSANPESQWWRIVRNSELNIPNEILRPSVGDKFVLTGIDAAKVGEAYVPTAEERLLAAANAYLEEISRDDSTYNCTLMSDTAKYWLDNSALYVGRKVTLYNPAYFGSEGRASRIIGYELKLDIPFDTPTLIVGDEAQYSRLGAIEDKINALAMSATKYRKGETILGSSSGSGGSSSGGTSVDLLTTGSDAEESDSTAYSSLRTSQDFVSKKRSERLNLPIVFLGGTQHGVYAEGESGTAIGSDGAITTNEPLTAKNINASGDITADNITAEGDINAVDITGNDLYATNNAYIDKAVEANSANIATTLTAAEVHGTTKVNTPLVEATTKVQTPRAEATEVITSSVKTADFDPDPLAGFGFGIYKDSTLSGDAKAVVDYLVVRKKMQVAVLEIAEYKSVNGGLVLSKANGVIENVDYDDSEEEWMCYLKNDESGTAVNRFEIHDLVRCQTWDMDLEQGQPLRYYWLEVTNKGITDNKAWIVLAKPTGFADSEPQADDVLVLMGNTTTATRQGFAIITDDGMAVYDGVNTTSIAASNLKAKFGNLANISFNGNTLRGYGLFGDNVFLKGSFMLHNNKTVETYVTDAADEAEENAKGYTDGRETLIRQDLVAAEGRFTSAISKVSASAQYNTNLARLTNRGTEGWKRYCTKSAADGSTNVSAKFDISEYGEGVSFDYQADEGETVPFSLGQQTFTYQAPFARTLVNGGNYALSAEILLPDGDSATVSLRLGVATSLTGNMRTYTQTSHPVTVHGNGTWQKISDVITISFDQQSTDTALCVVFYFRNTCVPNCAIRNLKVEEGDTATTYTKAPEDTEDEFAEVRSEISQTAESISMEVVGMLLNNDQDTLYTNATPEFTLNSSTRLWGGGNKFAISKYLSTGYYTIVMSIEIGSAWTGFSLAIESYSYISFSFTNEERNKGATVTQAIKRTFFFEGLDNPSFKRVYIRMDGANVGDTNAEAVLHGVWLYEGDGVVGSLARTGIDIETGVITLQADTVKVKDTNGNVNGVFNASDGTLQTNRIRVAELDASLIDTNHLVARDSNGMVKATVNADFVNGTLTQTNDGAYRIYYPSTQVNSEWVQNTAKKLELLDVNRGDANDPYWTTLRMFDTDGQTIAWELGTDAMTNGFTNPNFTLVNIAKNVNTDTAAKVAVNFDSQVCKWNETSGTLVAVSGSPISTSNAYYEAEYTASKTMWDENIQQYITLTGQTLYSRRKWTYNSSTTKWEIDTITWLVTDDTPDQNARTL